MYFYCLFNFPNTAKAVDIMECLKMDLGGSVVKKHFCLGKIRFESYIIRILSRKSKSKMFTFPYRFGGGGVIPSGQPDRFFPVFFLMTSLR